MGRVLVVNQGKVARFTVTHPDEVKKIIDIFTKHELLTTKRLDFNDFVKLYNIRAE